MDCYQRYIFYLESQIGKDSSIEERERGEDIFNRFFRSKLCLFKGEKIVEILIRYSKTLSVKK